MSTFSLNINKVDVVPNDHIQTHAVMYKNQQMSLSKTLSDWILFTHFSHYMVYI